LFFVSRVPLSRRWSAFPSEGTVAIGSGSDGEKPVIVP